MAPTLGTTSASYVHDAADQLTSTTTGTTTTAYDAEGNRTRKGCDTGDLAYSAVAYCSPHEVPW
ncbi:hypothetical protein ACIBAI_18510 [Streptomyces sp. NPDC051041]|uniref:hypothetical protein n=1 Tax=Streptomyces sp. NPDC051041 TaxID=3365640 RepID=UPI0037BB90A4